ncbi:putative reverse transcriptase domain-containing protein [Tanacetum coccineum]
MPPRCNRVKNGADPAFAAAVEQAVASLLPNLTARITDEIRQNENNANQRNGRRGPGNNRDAQPTDIHVWLERFQKQKPQTFSSASTPVEAKNWIAHIEILNTEFTNVAQVANAARNIEIFRDMSKNEGNNKRDRDDHRIQPSETLSQGSNHRAYDRRDSDRYGNSDRYSNRDRYWTWSDQDQQFHPRKACHRAIGACFECGEVGHLAKDFKKGSMSSEGNGNNKPHATRGKVYALTTDQAANASGTVSGTLYMCDRDVFVLFYTGATHSMVSLAFSKHIKFPSTLLDYALSISTPMKNNVVIGHEYRDCLIRFDDKIRSAILLPLEMSNFDIILGMDWLTENPATIDCHTKRVIFGDFSNPEFIYQGSRPGKPIKTISALKARKLISHGCEGFLASIKDISLDGPRFESHLVAQNALSLVLSS